MRTLQFKKETELRCKVVHCGNRALKDGLCHSHYRRFVGYRNCCSSNDCFSTPVYLVIAGDASYNYYRCEKHKNVFSLRRNITKKIIPLEDKTK